MAQPSFSMEQELLDELDNTLTYGDSRSEWVRDAIKLKLEVMEILEEHETDLTESERRELVSYALVEHLDNE
mgnify:CR=1 FL=1